MSRVAKDGATFEAWHPYAFHNDAFLYGHEAFLTEEQWLHLCLSYSDVWYPVINSKWLLNKIVYVIHPDVCKEISSNDFSIAFALKYFKNIVKEIGLFITIKHDKDTKSIEPEKFYSHGRSEELHTLK